MKKTILICIIFLFLSFLNIFLLKAQQLDPTALLQMLQSAQGNNGNNNISQFSQQLPQMDWSKFKVLFSNPQLQKLLQSGKFANIVDREKLMKVLKAGGVKSLTNPQVLMSIINREELMKLANDPSIQQMMSGEAIAPLLKMIKGMGTAGINLENIQQGTAGNIDLNNLNLPDGASEQLEQVKQLLNNGALEQNFQKIEYLQQIMNEGE